MFQSTKSLFSHSSKKKKNKHRLMEDDSDKSEMDDGIGKADNTSEQIVREPSPELARISALITRPPKQKSNKRKFSAIYYSIYSVCFAFRISSIKPFLKNKLKRPI